MSPFVILLYRTSPLEYLYRGSCIRSSDVLECCEDASSISEWTDICIGGDDGDCIDFPFDGDDVSSPSITSCWSSPSTLLLGAVDSTGALTARVRLGGAISSTEEVEADTAAAAIKSATDVGSSCSPSLNDRRDTARCRRSGVLVDVTDPVLSTADEFSDRDDSRLPPRPVEDMVVFLTDPSNDLDAGRLPRLNDDNEDDANIFLVLADDCDRLDGWNLCDDEFNILGETNPETRTFPPRRRPSGNCPVLLWRYT